MKEELQTDLNTSFPESSLHVVQNQVAFSLALIGAYTVETAGANISVRKGSGHIKPCKTERQGHRDEHSEEA